MCKINNRSYVIWAVTKDTKIIRLTFSRILAEFLTRYDPSYSLVRYKVTRGRLLAIEEESNTGIYLLCTKECGTPLRASLIRGVTQLHHDPESRLIYEGHLIRNR
jgi:hypothetical protein